MKLWATKDKGSADISLWQQSRPMPIDACGQWRPGDPRNGPCWLVIADSDFDFDVPEDRAILVELRPVEKAE